MTGEVVLAGAHGGLGTSDTQAFPGCRGGGSWHLSQN
jgi:hypothetical protein